MPSSEAARILVVDPSPANLLAVEAILEGPRYHLVNARSGEEALRLAASEDFALVLLEASMPGMDGFETARSIRGLEASRSTPILFVIAETGTEEVVRRGYPLGAVDYVVAPLVPEILRARVRSFAERYRVTRELRQSQESLNAVMDASVDGLLIVTAEGRITCASASVARLLGRPSRDLVGTLFGFPVRAGATVELDLVCEDAEQVSAEMRASETRWRGQPASLVSLRDITPQREAEAERHRLTLALDQAGYAVVVTDLDGAIRHVNAAFERMTGFRSTEVLGQNPRILKAETQGSDVYEELWSEITRGRSWTGRLVNQRKDGTRFTVEAVISPVFAAGGEIVSYIGVQRNITGEVRLEAQLRQTQKMEALGRLAGGVAHDFNNILGVITGYGELAQRQLAPDHAVRPRIDRIIKAAGHATVLTRQLLAFSRKQAVEPRILDLNDIVVDTRKMLGRLIGEDVELLIFPAEGLGTIRADPGQIEQIIMNLAVNACDAMPKGGSLVLETANTELDEIYAEAHPLARAGRYVVLAISDTGVGMDEETQSRLFEPFFTTKPKGEGTGLGLATVHGIVTQSGGHVAAYSESGRGTTFRVYLPRVEEPTRVPEVVPAAAARGTETILLVEDESVLQEVIQETLVDSGYTVLLAPDGERALARAAECDGAIDLLLSDIAMPKLGGVELAEKLSARNPGLRVLLMSGYPKGAMSRQGLSLEGIRLLEKPFTRALLLRLVRETLDRAPPGDPGDQW